MKAFDNYLMGKVMARNPALMKEYMDWSGSRRVADQAPYVFGTPGSPEQQTPHDYPMMEGEQPVTGLMDVTPAVQPTGLFDDTVPDDRKMLEFNMRAAQSGVPQYQDLAMRNMGVMQSGASNPAGMVGFGAARRMVQDSEGDQFWVGNYTDKATRQMKTTYSPIGHGKQAPVGQVELIDDLGLTSGEKIDYTAEIEGAKRREIADTQFYLDYVPETRVIEEGIYDIEYTQNLLNKMSGQTDYSTTGFGKWINGIPLTDAKHWTELKSTVQSRLALNKMMALKQASSTGSTGFGALSEKELKLLTDHLGSLEQAQSPAEIKRVITRIYQHLEHTKKGYRSKLTDNREKYKRLHDRYRPGEALPSFYTSREPGEGGKQRRKWGEGR